MARTEASQPVTRLWLALPYLLVVASTVVTVARGSSAQPLLVVGLGVAVLGWHTWWAVLHPAWLEHQVAPMLVYFTGMLAASAWLLHLSFSFMLLYLVCFALAFVALPGGWAYLGVAATVATMLLVPSLLTPGTENLVVVIAGGVVTVVAGWSIRAVEEESAARRAALADLGRSNAELERALATNAELHAELVEIAHRQGVARERSRIAAEIHDTLAADLAGVVAQLEALSAEVSDPDVGHRVAGSLELARAALREARSSVTSMRTQDGGEDLADALDRAVRRASATTEIEVRLAVDGDPVPMPDGTSGALVRATEEALRNALRHAGAGSVVVTLSYLGESVTVDVVDDGRGFVPDATQDGNGLAIMAERLGAAGGNLEIASEPGGGTTVTLIAPLEAGRCDVIRVIVVDDHPVVRDGVQGQLAASEDVTVVGEAASATEALAVLARTGCDVLIADLRLPDVPPGHLVREVRTAHPDLVVLVLSTYATPTDVRTALDAGADGYLVKDSGRAELVDAVRRARRGGRLLGRSVPDPGAGAAVPSPRELQVLELVAAGLTNRQIARRLLLGEATVKTHLQHVSAKLGAVDRASAVAAGYRQGLLRPPEA